MRFLVTQNMSLSEAEELNAEIQQELQRLNAIISEVHSWIVCAPTASAEDMMQNAGRVIEITTPADVAP